MASDLASFICQSPLFPECAFALPSSPCHPGSSIMIIAILKVQLPKRKCNVSLRRHSSMEATVRTTIAQQPALTVYGCNVARKIVDMLPDAALLDIYDLHGGKVETWDTPVPVHVCRNW